MYKSLTDGWPIPCRRNVCRFKRRATIVQEPAWRFQSTKTKHEKKKFLQQSFWRPSAHILLQFWRTHPDKLSIATCVNRSYRPRLGGDKTKTTASRNALLPLPSREAELSTATPPITPTQTTVTPTTKASHVPVQPKFHSQFERIPWFWIPDRHHDPPAFKSLHKNASSAFARRIHLQY